MLSIFEEGFHVDSREEFAAFVRELVTYLTQHPEKWQNSTLEDYLNALASWVEDYDGYFKNRGEPVPEQPDWTLFANIMYAAAIYD
jgi:hypothetical protein